MLLSEIEIINDISRRGTTFNTMLRQWNVNFKKQRPRLLGAIDNFRLAIIDGISYDATSKLLAAYDLEDSKYAVFLQLEHFHGGAQNAYVVSAVGANKQYRGINLPVRMYAYLIQEEGMILVSDEIQTEGGKSIWEKLANIPNIGIYGYNDKTHKVFQIEMDDLFNEDVYDEGLNAEIEDLENEEYELQDVRNERYFQVKKELEKLYASRIETNHHIRLFAARAK